MRLARTVRMIPAFKEMWMLLKGMTDSIRLVVWTLVILAVLLYMFSIIAVETIARSEGLVEDEFIQDRLGNLWKALFTMFQILTLDSWSTTIVRPIMDKSSGSVGIFFIVFIMIGV